jgi:hypothetical protein
MIFVLVKQVRNINIVVRIKLNFIKTKKMQIKLPRTINDLRINHVESIAEMDLDKMSVLDRAVICSQFTGVDVETVRRFAFDDVLTIMNHYFTLIGLYNSNKLPKDIEVNGIIYCLIDKAEKMPTDWHIDMSGFKMEDICNVAAFYYIEQGMEYCEMDNNKNILNPVSERSKIFREHLPLPILLDLRERYNIEAKELQEKLYGKPKENQKEPKSERYDWENAVHFVADRLKVNWETITKNNIFWFKHKCDYFNYLMRQKK